jgi:hypothetical protein
MEPVKILFARISLPSVPRGFRFFSVAGFGDEFGRQPIFIVLRDLRVLQWR